MNPEDIRNKTPTPWTAVLDKAPSHRALVGTELEVDLERSMERCPPWCVASDDSDGVLSATRYVDIDQTDQKGRSPLSCAAANGNVGVVDLLLATKSVTVDRRDRQGRGPLSWAAASGDSEVVKVLLGTGQVDVNQKDHGDRSPLSWAAANGDSEAVKGY